MHCKFLNCSLWLIYTNRVCNFQLVPNVEYTVKVTGKNSAGILGEPSKLSFQLTGSKKIIKSLELLILTASVIRPYEDAVCYYKLIT